MLTWDELRFTDAADIDMTVWDTCGPGGTPSILAQDTSRDLRARLRITNAASKCLQLRLYGFHVPAGETRPYTVCHYYQSDNTVNH